MNRIQFPEGMWLEPVQKKHPRRTFHCGEVLVNDWLRSKALQHQEKQLSVTKVLLDRQEVIVGFYTLATGQVDFDELPPELVRQLPRRALPVAILAWLGVAQEYQGRKLGDLLLAQALRDCFEAGKTFAFIAVLLDCINDGAKAFYSRWNFSELPGNSNRLFLSSKLLSALMEQR